MEYRGLFLKAAVVGSVAIAAPAAAEPILLDAGSVGDSFTIEFDGFVDGGPSIDGLSSELTLTLTSIDGTSYNFDYSVTNVGTADDGIDSRVSSFAFNTDPNIDSATSTGTFGFTTLSSNYPNGIGTVDVCFKGTNTGSCSGGGSAGLFEGESGSGSLSLTFDSAPTELTLDDFFVRYQSITGIDNVGSASGRQTSSSSGTDVPEPSMMLLFAAAAFGGMFLARRRRRFTAQPRVTVAYA